MRTDCELIREYVQRSSEPAFAELVKRHLPFVYAAALRVVVDPHLAEDVTQTTFALLARQARLLQDRETMTGWLHRTALNQAAYLVRGQMRRRAREQKASVMQTTITEPESESQWEQIAPLVDEAINKLADADRTAIFLRFFQNKTAAQIGATLKIGDEAAQKRVRRALEKLRALLAAQGISISAGALAVSLSTQNAIALPAGLAGTIVTGALAAKGSALILTGFQLILMSKAKVTTVSALLLAGIATPLVVQHQSLSRLRAENAALKEQQASFRAPASKEETPPSRERDATQAPTRAQLSELMRLRSEVGPLRRDSQELARLRTREQAASAPSRDINAAADAPFLPSNAWANRGTDKPESALETFFWAGKQGETNLVGNLLRWKRDPDIPASDELDQTFEKTMIGGTTRFAGELQGFRVTSVGKQENDEMQVQVELTDKDGKAQTHNLRLVQEDGQWFPVMNVWLHEKNSIRAAMDTPEKFTAP